MDIIKTYDEQFYASIRDILLQARNRAYTAVNFAMVESYWLIGQQIVEHEQKGEARADYGKGVMREVARRLTAEFGKGFDERELRKMRQFYQMFQKRDTLRPELTYTVFTEERGYREVFHTERRQTDFRFTL